MQIIINPVAATPGQADDTVTVDGDTITVNGEGFDLSGIPEGGEADAEGEHPFTGTIRRENGELIVPLRVRVDWSTAEPQQPREPGHWTVNISSGALPDRVVRTGVEA